MARDFCDTNGFELVGKACVSYGKEALTLDMLENQHFKKSEGVVLFEVFGGIDRERRYRLDVRNTKCDRSGGGNSKLAQPNPSVFSDYIQKYLNGSCMISLSPLLTGLGEPQSFQWNSGS